MSICPCPSVHVVSQHETLLVPSQHTQYIYFGVRPITIAVELFFRTLERTKNEKRLAFRLLLVVDIVTDAVHDAPESMAMCVCVVGRRIQM